MSFFNRRFNTYRPDQQFEVLSYKISFEPLGNMDEEMAGKLEKVYHQAQKGKRGTVERLKKFIAKYPNEPTAKNYLFVCYMKQGKKEEAHKVLQRTIEKHPDYLFGRLGMAQFYLDNGEYEKIKDYLGDPMELDML